MHRAKKVTLVLTYLLEVKIRLFYTIPVEGINHDTNYLFSVKG